MRHRRAHVRSIVALVALLTAAAACPTETSPARIAPGNWGGDHIGLIVTDTGATIEYDCAHGSINEPLRLDPAGNFDWLGIHYIDHGGPVFEGEHPNPHVARYTGHATERTMTLTLRLLDTTFAPQTFTLSRDGNPRVFKCL